MSVVKAGGSALARRTVRCRADAVHWRCPPPSALLAGRFKAETVARIRQALPIPTKPSIRPASIVRLRVETHLGLKMVKYVLSTEFIKDFRAVGPGQGGFREDPQFYGPEAAI